MRAQLFQRVQAADYGHINIQEKQVRMHCLARREYLISFINLTYDPESHLIPVHTVFQHDTHQIFVISQQNVQHTVSPLKSSDRYHYRILVQKCQQIAG